MNSHRPLVAGRMDDIPERGKRATDQIPACNSYLPRAGHIAATALDIISSKRKMRARQSSIQKFYLPNYLYFRF